MRLAAVMVAAGLLVLSPSPRANADPVKRKLLEHPDPAYPAEAKRLRIEGAVILRIVIAPDGHVTNALAASGNAMLMDAAQAAAKQWKYSPAPEETVSVVQINFSLK